MKVVSLVPSWTETLIAAGVHVVGRTRFCIHPQNQVNQIPIIGGTKDWSWEKIQNLNPDLILLDQEENPKFMSEQISIPWHATHIRTVEDMAPTLNTLSSILKNKTLESYSQRWAIVSKKSIPYCKNALSQIPSVVAWGKRPTSSIEKIIYMIWRDPWMCVSRDTFIGSMLEKFDVRVEMFSEKYPKINLNAYDPERTLILFSSEPYPFYKKRADLENFQFPHAHVDGESWSWFGVRSLEFLERNL